MGTPAAPTFREEDAASAAAAPLLEAGDRISRDEFESRYDQMRDVKKAELIEGIVYMPSPVRARRHAQPHSRLAAWLETYASATPGVECFDNPTVRLDSDNEPQPDLVLLKAAGKGGQARISADDYIEGPPDLVVEIVGSSRAYDLHQKKTAYARNGVREYLAWVTSENYVVWWALADGEFREIGPGAGERFESCCFPGLWLDAAALLRGDMATVLATLRSGLESLEHRASTKGRVSGPGREIQ